MARKLTDKHLKKLVIVVGLPLEKVVELDSMGLFDAERAVALLVKYDWRLLLKRANNYTANQRIKAIAKEYNVSEYYVRKIVYSRNTGHYYCKKCGIEITKLQNTRNQGLCEECTVDSIKL